MREVLISSRSPALAYAGPGLMERYKTNREGGAEVECRWTPWLLDIAHASGDPFYYVGPLILFEIIYLCDHLLSLVYWTTYG